MTAASVKNMSVSAASQNREPLYIYHTLYVCCSTFSHRLMTSLSDSFHFAASTVDVKETDEAAATECAAAGATVADESEVSSLNEVPFQVQIRYTDTKGTVALRVLTKTQPITRDRKQAEKSNSLFYFV